MTDATKIAAATLAAEASRQAQALRVPVAQQGGRDIAGELLNYYRHFAREIEKEKD